MGALSKDASILKQNLANAGTRKTGAAKALGSAGGKQTSPKKTKAARLNARKGGWPKGRPRKGVSAVKTFDQNGDIVPSTLIFDEDIL
jgi:hypothetical protein